MTITPEEVAKLLFDHNKGRAQDHRGFTTLELRAHDMAALIAELVKERDKWATYASLYSNWVNDVAELLEERRADLNPEDWEDQKLLALMDQAEAGIAAAYRTAQGQE